MLTLKGSNLLKKLPSSHTEYRAFASNLKGNQNEMTSIYYWLEKINESELSIILVTLFVGNQPIRNQHFLKVNCISIFKNLNLYLKFV